MIAALQLPTPLPTRTGVLTLRRAGAEDLPAVLRLLADDPISAARGERADPGAPEHRRALAEITADPSNELVVAADAAGEVVATLQLTRTPGLTRRGATRLLVEAVRVSSAQRSGGVGTALMGWVTGTAAPAVGASLVELTSHEDRRDAHRFYERLGFTGSHRGFKLTLDPAP